VAGEVLGDGGQLRLGWKGVIKFNFVLFGVLCSVSHEPVAIGFVLLGIDAKTVSTFFIVLFYSMAMIWSLQHLNLLHK